MKKRIFIIITTLYLSLILYSTCTPAPKINDFSSDTMYFILIDRFFDGDANWSLPENIYSPNREKWKLYWGGDLQGIIDKLNYLEEMGVSAIWITPIIKNTPFLYSDGKMPMAAYHGYWPIDFMEINPAFGTMAKFKELVKLCHSKGIKIYLDIVINHTNPINSGCYGELQDNGKFISNYHNDSAEIFHHNGSVCFEDSNLSNWQNKNLFDLADLNQNNPFVDNYLKKMGIFWLKTGIDGFRIDTARYLPPQWLKIFIEDMQKVNNKKVFIFSEWSGGGPSNTICQEFEKITNSSLLDFTFQWAIQETVGKGNSFKILAKTLEEETKLKNANTKINFIDNHDMPRFLSTCITYLKEKNPNTQADKLEQEAHKRLEMAVYLMMISRGIPCIYYGTEQYLHREDKSDWGIGGEPYNRQMMASFTINEFIKNIKKLSKARKENPAISKGNMKIIIADDNLLVLERYFSDQNYVVAAFNKGERVNIKVNSSLPSGIYKKSDGDRCCLMGKPINVINSSFNLSLDKFECGIWIYRKMVSI